MSDTLKHIAQHAAMHVAKEAAKGAGCMVTFFLMFTGLGALSAVVVLLL